MFVPYWTLTNGLQVADYDSVSYFAVTAGTKGLVTTDAGYQGIATFLTQVPSRTKKYLTLQMTNTDVNNEVLQNESVQKEIATQIASLAKQKGFDGVILDFEISALSFQSVVQHITHFTTLVADAAHANQLRFGDLVYGDTFYRARPYDIGAIGEKSDSVFVMAYDFHKANGSPGPNFQLHGVDENYNFTLMTQDFLKYVPKEKLSIVFGLFGYDWSINAKGDSLKQAAPLSLGEINTKIIAQCTLLHCQQTRDASSQETKIIYTDANKQSHVVWFEDMTSVAAKRAFLQGKGIQAVSFWAYSYF